MPRLSELTNKWLSAAFAYQGVNQEVESDCRTLCGSPISDDLKGIFNRTDEANAIGAMYCAEDFGMVTIRITLQKTKRDDRGIRVTHIQQLPDRNRLRVCYVINSINDRCRTTDNPPGFIINDLLSFNEGHVVLRYML